MLSRKCRKYLLGGLLMSLFLIGCTKDNALDCFKSSGKDESVIRPTGSFDYIEVYARIDVTVFHGSEYKVEVIAGKHISKNIITKVENNTLIVDDNNVCNFVRGYKRVIKVNITVPHVTKIANNGVGTVSIDAGFIQDTLTARAESSGDFKIKGRFNELRTSSHGNGDMYINASCNSLYVYAKGTNFVYAEDLLVKDYIFIESATMGDCTVNVQGVRFDYNIHDYGNIYYFGEPSHVNNWSSESAKGKAIQK